MSRGFSKWDNEALRLFRRRADQGDLKAISRLADLAVKHGRFDVAQDALELARRDAPVGSSIFQKVKRIYDQLEPRRENPAGFRNPDEAFRELERGGDWEDPQFCVKLFVEAMRFGKHELAVKIRSHVYERAIYKDPGDVRGWVDAFVKTPIGHDVIPGYDGRERRNPAEDSQRWAEVEAGGGEQSVEEWHRQRFPLFSDELANALLQAVTQGGERFDERVATQELGRVTGGRGGSSLSPATIKKRFPAAVAQLEAKSFVRLVRQGARSKRLWEVTKYGAEAALAARVVPALRAAQAMTPEQQLPARAFESAPGVVSSAPGVVSSAPGVVQFTAPGETALPWRSLTQGSAAFDPIALESGRKIDYVREQQGPYVVFRAVDASVYLAGASILVGELGLLLGPGDDRRFNGTRNFATVSWAWIHPEWDSSDDPSILRELHKLAAEEAARHGLPLASGPAQPPSVDRFWARQVRAGKARPGFHFAPGGFEAKRFFLPLPPPVLANPRRRRKKEGAEATYQERRMSVETPVELRLDPRFMVSDLGIWAVPMEAREKVPAGVTYFQVVDAHQGYAAAEGELLRLGFGYTRSWHYSLLGHPEHFRDGEGHVVKRWIRLLKRGQRQPDRSVPLIPWAGENPRRNPASGDEKIRELEREWRRSRGSRSAYQLVSEILRHRGRAPVEAIMDVTDVQARSELYVKLMSLGQLFHEHLGAMAAFGDPAALATWTPAPGSWLEEERIARAIYGAGWAKGMEPRVTGADVGGYNPIPQRIDFLGSISHFFAVLMALPVAEAVFYAPWGQEHELLGDVALSVFMTTRAWLAGDPGVRGRAVRPRGALVTQQRTDAVVRSFFRDRRVIGLEYYSYMTNMFTRFARGVYEADLAPAPGTNGDYTAHNNLRLVVADAAGALAARREFELAGSGRIFDLRRVAGNEADRELGQLLLGVVTPWALSAGPGKWVLPPTAPLS